MRTQQGFFSQKDREMALEPTTGTDFVSGIDKKAMPFKKQFLSDDEDTGKLKKRPLRPSSAINSRSAQKIQDELKILEKNQ